MTKDPIVEEVRQARRDIEREYGSPQAYSEHLKEVQDQWQRGVVRREPQRLSKLKEAS